MQHPKVECEICNLFWRHIHLHKGIVMCSFCFRKTSMTHFKCSECKRTPIEDFNLSGLCESCWKHHNQYKE
jgi:hypothetical protein